MFGGIGGAGGVEYCVSVPTAGVVGGVSCTWVFTGRGGGVGGPLRLAHDLGAAGGSSELGAFANCGDAALANGSRDNNSGLSAYGCRGPLLAQPATARIPATGQSRRFIVFLPALASPLS